MTSDDVEIGEILGGKYRVERILGQGTMGVVLAATQIGLDRIVALKLMSGERAALRENAERFLREARVASMLKSPHAGKVLDVGELACGDPYIVMEFLDGQDLAAIVKERGPLPVGEALALVLQACEAIAEAHSLGIVHRDLKPANLFLTTGPGASPCVKVLDFGVSKQQGSSLDLTRTGQLLGSPLYMAPEQLNSSKDVDTRADIWALGVILYELLAAVTPYHATTILEMCRKLSTETPTPLADHRPDVPAGLCAVIMQCLEKNSHRRWPNVATFAAALAPFASKSAAAYVERIARAQQVDVEAQEPTTALVHLLSGEPTRAEEGARMPEADTTDQDTTTTLVRPLSVQRLARAQHERGKAPQRARAWARVGALAVVLFAGTASTLAARGTRSAPVPEASSVLVAAVVAEQPIPLALSVPSFGALERATAEPPAPASAPMPETSASAGRASPCTGPHGKQVRRHIGTHWRVRGN